MSLRRLSAALVIAAFAVAGCSSGGETTQGAASAGTSAAKSGEPLVIYSGRSEELVGPLLEQLQQATGGPVEVRYAGSSELAAQILEEGDNTNADLFFSQDAGALGALAKENRLAQLPESVTNQVGASWVGKDRRWVATSARARVVAYNPAKAAEAAEFTSIDAILDPKYSGQVGYAPTNASFHSFVTALRLDRGEDGAKQWLTKFKANKPVAFEKNGLVLDAVDSGQVSLGLINHYYWHEKVAEVGADKVTAKIRFLNSDDPGALINVAGLGIIEGSEQADAAQAAVSYLLSAKGQQYFADETAEYPVVAGISTTKHNLPPLSELTGSSVDLGNLDSLDASLAMLNEVGLT